jgi:hypothetical protein
MVVVWAVVKAVMGQYLLKATAAMEAMVEVVVLVVMEVLAILQTPPRLKEIMAAVPLKLATVVVEVVVVLMCQQERVELVHQQTEAMVVMEQRHQFQV